MKSDFRNCLLFDIFSRKRNIHVALGLFVASSFNEILVARGETTQVQTAFKKTIIYFYFTFYFKDILVTMSDHTNDFFLHSLLDKEMAMLPLSYV